MIKKELTNKKGGKDNIQSDSTTNTSTTSTLIHLPIIGRNDENKCSELN